MGKKVKITLKNKLRLLLSALFRNINLMYTWQCNNCFNVKQQLLLQDLQLKPLLSNFEIISGHFMLNAHSFLWKEFLIS